jgi:hypothetical protein
VIGNSNSQADPRSRSWLPVFIIAGMFGVALFCGLLIPLLPWWFLLMFFAVPVAFVVAASYPYLGLLVALALIFEVIPEAVVPRLPIGGGNFKLYDLMILFLCGIVVLRALANRISVRAALGSYWWPLIYLFACVGVSLIYVRYFAPNKFMLSDARNVIGWLLVPLILLGVDTPQRYRYFVRGVLLIGLVIAIYVCIESITGKHIMTSARVEVLDNGANSDITRSIAGGGTYIMIFAMYYFLMRLRNRELPVLLTSGAILLLIAGLAVTFGRGVWLATAVGLLFSAALHKGAKGVFSTALIAVVAVSVCLSVAMLVKPRLGEAVMERALGIRAEVESGGSFGWRALENRAAWNKIQDYPLTGVGLGGDYKQTTSSQGSFANETSYIHNAYMYFPLKMGIHAALIPFLLMLAFARSAISAFRESGSDRGLLAITCGAFLVPVITSYTQPEWASAQGITAFSIFMSMIVLHARFRASQLQASVGSGLHKP